MILIPRVFNRIWVGPYSMPEQFKAWGKTWLEHNPGWAMRTWTEGDLSELGHLDEISRACNRSQISNIMRWSLMAKHGGIYIDTDFECLQPIEPILENVSCFVSKKLRSNLLMAAIFGCVPGHPLANALESHTHTKDPALIYDLGSRYLTDEWRLNSEGVTVFEADKFCPLHHEDVGQVARNFSGSFGVHHWTSVTHNNLGFERLI